MLLCSSLIPSIVNTLEEIPPSDGKILNKITNVSPFELMKKIKSEEKKKIISLDDLESYIEAKGKMILVEKK